MRLISIKSNVLDYMHSAFSLNPSVRLVTVTIDSKAKKKRSDWLTRGGADLKEGTNKTQRSEFEQVLPSQDV